MPDSGQERPRPLRKDAELNRQRILRAAAQVFTTRGLQASLDDVARQAGVGVGTVYRRFPDKEALVEALFEERIAELVGLAEEALTVPDSWEGLVQFLRRAGTALAGDRGLRQILMFADYGRNRVERGKAQMQPVITRLVQRAQQDGKLRADLMPTDFPFIEFMLTAAAEYAAPVKPDVWLRYLTLIIDGMQPSRETVTPLPVDALTPDQMLGVMRSIPPGTRAP
ncbi:MAG TPA: TetR/AcrR family transcriptional regulator [Streptosporangiaceae bacterium]